MNKLKSDVLDRIRYTPTAAVAINAIVVLNGLVGIALEAIAANALGYLLVRGEVEVTSDSGTAWSEGDEIFYDATNSVFSATAAGNVYAGRASRAKTSGATTAYVNLNLPRPLAAGTPFAITVAVASGAAADVDTIVRQDCRVIDVVAQQNGAGEASDTLTVQEGANAITDAMAWSGADKAVVRAGTIDDAYASLSAGDTLRVSPSDDDAGDDLAAGTVTVLCVAT